MCAEAVPGRYMPYGCSHYMRKCALVAGCCQKEYMCHLCHDEKENHDFNRDLTLQVVCQFCKDKQPVGITCRNCFIPFATYYCSTCLLYEDEDKEHFHCDQCGSCRYGGYENFFHCIKCAVCFNLELIEHKCIERVSRSDCPLCLEYLHSSRLESVMLPCGHIIHNACWDELQSSFGAKCPSCQAFVKTQNYIRPSIAPSAV